MKLPMKELPKTIVFTVLLFSTGLLLLLTFSYLGAHTYLLIAPPVSPPMTPAEIFMQAASAPLVCDEPQKLKGKHYGTGY